jgi:hypothetical protein
LDKVMVRLVLVLPHWQKSVVPGQVAPKPAAALLPGAGAAAPAAENGRSLRPSAAAFFPAPTAAASGGSLTRGFFYLPQAPVHRTTTTASEVWARYSVAQSATRSPPLRMHPAARFTCKDTDT